MAKDSKVLIAVLEKEIKILEQELERLKQDKESAKTRAAIEENPVQRKEWLKTVKKIEKQITGTETFIIQKISQLNKLNAESVQKQAA